MVKKETNLITKYEADTYAEVESMIKESDKNTTDIKFTYTAKSGKYDLVIRTLVAGKED